MVKVVCGIDVGIVNLAISFFAINDDGTRRFLYAENGSLLKRKNGLTYLWKQSHAATLVNYFIQDREQLFSNIDLCLIEIQARMKIIQVCLESNIVSRGAIVRNVAPIIPKKYFGCSMGNYTLNKKMAIKTVDRLLTVSERQKMVKACGDKKRDDLADATIYCLWAIPHYDELIETTRVRSLEEIAFDKKKRRALKALETQERNAKKLEEKRQKALARAEKKKEKEETRLKSKEDKVSKKRKRSTVSSKSDSSLVSSKSDVDQDVETVPPKRAKAKAKKKKETKKVEEKEKKAKPKKKKPKAKPKKKSSGTKKKGSGYKPASFGRGGQKSGGRSSGRRGGFGGGGGSDFV